MKITYLFQINLHIQTKELKDVTDYFNRTLQDFGLSYKYISYHQAQIGVVNLTSTAILDDDVIEKTRITIKDFYTEKFKHLLSDKLKEYEPELDCVFIGIKEKNCE